MHRYKFTAAFTGLFILSLFSWNCTKIDTTVLGGDLIPAVDNVHTFAIELGVIAHNYDSVAKECLLLQRDEDYVLGYISNDPYFGKTDASIFVQLLPPAYPNSYPAKRDSLYLDSVVLVLSYKGTYGDTLATQKVNVYPITSTEVVRNDTTYNTCTSFLSDVSNLLGSKTFAPKNLSDSQILFKERAKNQLRIKLTNTFGNALLDQDSATGFKTDSAFKAFFRGFAIKPDISFGGNALNTFNLRDTNTKVALYYRYMKNGKLDTVVNYFRLTTLSGAANNINRDHSGAEINNHLAKPAAGDSVIYIQATPGTYALLRFPELHTLDNRIIHRAELIIDQVYSASPTDLLFPAPDFLFLDIIDTAAKDFRAVPCDFSAASGAPNIARFGGFKTTVKDPFGNSISRYVFNVTRYSQATVTRHIPDITFRLRAPFEVVSTNTILDECGQTVLPYNFLLNQVATGRVKLGGGNNTNYRMRLRIIYSKI